jgi:hypothetical protein
VWRDFPLVGALVGTCASIASFVALMEITSPERGVLVLEHVSLVLVALSIAGALAVERRATTGAWQAQIAAAAVSVAFLVVALVKLYSKTSTIGESLGQSLSWMSEAEAVAPGALAFGLIGLRLTTSASWTAFLAAVCAAVGLAGYATYALSVELNTKAFVWYLAAGTAATLAGSAAARMRRR